MKFRKKPVVIEAVKFEDTIESLKQLAGLYDLGEPVRVSYQNPDKPVVLIKTLEGVMTAQIGDYIIKGVKGELYPCKPDIFEATYEEAGSNAVAYVVMAENMKRKLTNYQVFTTIEGADACKNLLLEQGCNVAVQTLPLNALQEIKEENTNV